MKARIYQLILGIILIDKVISNGKVRDISFGCNFNANPVPPYHTPDEDSLNKVKSIINDVLLDYGVSQGGQNKMIDQVIEPVTVRQRIRDRINNKNNEGGLRKLISFRVPFNYAYYLSHFCFQCFADNQDDTGAENNDRALESFDDIADILKQRLVHSGMPYFEETQCVTFECEGIFSEKSEQCTDEIIPFSRETNCSALSTKAIVGILFGSIVAAVIFILIGYKIGYSIISERLLTDYEIGEDEDHPAKSKIFEAE